MSEVHLLDNTHLFNKSRNFQPYEEKPIPRTIPFDPSRVKYPHGKRLCVTKGSYFGTIVRILHTRAEVEDCDDYDSYCVGVGFSLQPMKWINVNDLSDI